MAEKSESVSKRLKKTGLKGKTITERIQQHEFKLITRSKTADHFVENQDETYESASQLLSENQPNESMRLLGIGLTNLNVRDSKTIKR